MADQRMIGEILSERRQSLGLSIDRVVNDTKLQRRMVEAFELTDFYSMPPKGYAQASLASYARYLGLNPNEILRIYEDQLYEFQCESHMGAPVRDRSYRASEEFDRSSGGRPASSRMRSMSYEGRPRPDRHDSFVRSAQNDPRFVGNRGAGAYREDFGQPPVDDRSMRSGRADMRPRGIQRDGYVRSVDRGLYDSGYRRSNREPSYQQYSGDYEGRSYRGERDPYGYASPDARPYPQDAAARRRPDRRMGNGRGEVQIVTLDDGYQGGSGGYGPDGYRYQQRPPQGGQRVSVSEILTGVVDSIKSDPKTLSLLAIIALCAVLVALIMGISSCVRDSDQGGTSGNIPVTSVTSASGGVTTSYSSTQLASSLNLSSLPADSILSITVNAGAAVSPWVEVRVDDVARAANIMEPESTLQFTITRNAYVLVSDSSSVTITVNGTQVHPTLENDSYVLRLAVATDQLPQ